MIKSNLKTLTGNLIGHRDGFGFLRPDDGGEDIFVPNREMLKAMHGDKVLARVLVTEKKGRLEAHITEVLKLAQITLVGRLIFEKGIYLVVPEDKRIKHDIIISSSDKGNGEPGQVVTVEIIDPPTRDTPPIGKIIEVIGGIDDPGMEIEIAVRKFGIPAKFSESVLKKAKEISHEICSDDLNNRVDLRDLDFITIDGEDARDFDDAVYAEAIDQKSWRLLVAIADVASYVKCGDLIDREAFKRTTSVYFPRKVVPMLPESLSNGICSLKPNEDRLTLVCDMVVSKAGKVSAYQFYEGVIRSSSRLTYTEVWDIISNTTAAEKIETPNVLAVIYCLSEMLTNFLNYRSTRGSIDFETTETEIKVNDHGKIEKILPKFRNPAHRIIEECMITANTCAADFLTKKKSNCLYRVHEAPSSEKISSLKEFLKTQGLKLKGIKAPSAKNFSELLNLSKERVDFQILQSLILRSMQQAKYSPNNDGHFALSLKNYAHFTSPIRRYPDLLVHRAIKAILVSKKYEPLFEEGVVKNSNSNIGKWTSIGEHCSIGERRAEEASRDVVAWLKCHFIKNRVGEQLIGTVTGVAPFGLFITLEELYVEGLLHVSELGAEYFQHNEITHELRGERTGKRYKLFEKIQIQVMRVDLDGRRVEFSLAPKLFRKIRNKKKQNDLESDEIVSATGGFFKRTVKNDVRLNSKKNKLLEVEGVINYNKIIQENSLGNNEDLALSKSKKIANKK